MFNLAPLPSQTKDLLFSAKKHTVSCSWFFFLAMLFHQDKLSYPKHIRPKFIGPRMWATNTNGDRGLQFWRSFLIKRKEHWGSTKAFVFFFFFFTIFDHSLPALRDLMHALCEHCPMIHSVTFLSSALQCPCSCVSSGKCLPEWNTFRHFHLKRAHFWGEMPPATTKRPGSVLPGEI